MASLKIKKTKDKSHN